MQNRQYSQCFNHQIRLVSRINVCQHFHFKKKRLMYSKSCSFHHQELTFSFVNLDLFSPDYSLSVDSLCDPHTDIPTFSH